MYFDRFDICEAYAMYDMLWGPTEYAARLHRIKFRASPLRSLENMSENAKEIYGRLVREHQRIYIAWERYQRRKHARKLAWPGTRNMPGGDPYRWLRKQGLLTAVETYA